ncbi:MAG: O-antigen ligase family protein [Patescibacteria group bacterium]
MNIFGKLSKITISFLILAELFSLIAYLLPPLNQVAFFAILGVALVLVLLKQEYGLYLILAELFIGGFGHLFSFSVYDFSISIRMALFALVLSVWLIRQILNFKLSIPKIPILYYLFFLILIGGVINGLWHNALTAVFFDANAWVYFILIFIFFDLIKNKEIVDDILQILVGSTAYLALKTIGILILFAQGITGIGGFFYKWLRDSGAGEVTYVSGSIFRVFLQSQIYCLIGLAIVLVILLAGYKKFDKKVLVFTIGYLYLTSLALIISQSRSYWVGAVAALFLILIFSWWQFGFRIKKTITLVAVLVIMVLSQLLLIQIMTGNFTGNIIANRFGNLKSEPAGISRLNQLPPLLFNIEQQAIFGYGFGKQLTYVSQDPRIVKNHPGGIYTTYAFEWGYLDIALKVGVIGLLVYLALIVQMFYQEFRRIRNYELRIMNNKEFQIPNSYFLIPGLLAGLLALGVTNIFSPYLNHPLGITYLLLASVIINQYDR